MASKMQKIKEFIETCPLLAGGHINVDYLDNKIYSYSIDRTPNEPIVNSFIDGGGKKQISFDFSVTLPLSSNALDNLINSEFGEDFMAWVETKNRERNLGSEIFDGAFTLKCTSPNYLLQKTDTTAIYIIQMNLTYYELIQEIGSF